MKLTAEQIAALPGMVARLNSNDGFEAWDASDSIISLAPSLAAAVIEQLAELDRLRSFISDFAATKFEQIDSRGRNWRGPEDDEDPVTDWMAVDAWQSDARDLLAVKP